MDFTLRMWNSRFLCIFCCAYCFLGLDSQVGITEIADVWERPADIEMGDNWCYSYETSKNLAFLKLCEQSSLHTYIRDKRAYPRAEIAVDGVSEGNCMMEQTSWTLEEEKPWWRVDLGETYKISEITIFNRPDAEIEQLKDFTVSLIDAGGSEVWKSVQMESPNPSVTIAVEGKEGSFVRIQLNGKGALALAEVIVK